MLIMDSRIGTRQAKDAMFDEFARVAAAVASGRRLEILDVLAQAPRTVEDIAGTINQSVANTSHHLRRLADDGLVASDKHGRHVTYRLASQRVYDLWRALQDVTAAHHHELEEAARSYLGDREEIDFIEWETLNERLDRGDHVVIIDVRPELEYRAGHLDGAINIPPDRLETLPSGLPTDGDVVAYCRGTYCAYADQAIRTLQTHGRRAFRLDGGYRDRRPLTHQDLPAGSQAHADPM
jgi:rhodanese-related sulfurtransferase/DNA-binding transcriptional ArsR family regulator